MFTTNFIGGLGVGGRWGGNIHGRKLAPENAPYENCLREICPPSPKEKKQKKEN